MAERTIAPGDLLRESLHRIASRVPHPVAGSEGEHLPWGDPAFSQRMLREHLDASHSLASRREPERQRIVDWIWGRVALEPGLHLLDVACGPGLYATQFAARGISVTGIDIAPAAIAHARTRAEALKVGHLCNFVEADVRSVNAGRSTFDVAMVLSGQITVFRPEETRTILQRLAAAVGPGGVVVLEALDGEQVPRSPTTSWYTAERGLWGDEPHLVLSERLWDDTTNASIQRFHVLFEETGRLEVHSVVDYAYARSEMVRLLEETGFARVDVYPAWDGLDVDRAGSFIVYVATAGPSV